MKTLRLKPISRDGFAPFGQVLLADPAAHHYPINNGTCTRYHNLGLSDPGGDGATIVSVFRAINRRLPFLLDTMERHPLGSQIFSPAANTPYAVVVANTPGPPTVDDLVGFILDPQLGGGLAGIGVNYHKNIWHHPLIALSDPAAPAATSDFWVVDRLGPAPNPGNNLEEMAITDWQVSIDR